MVQPVQTRVTFIISIAIWVTSQKYESLILACFPEHSYKFKSVQKN